jgi:hypothetical protein
MAGKKQDILVFVDLSEFEQFTPTPLIFKAYTLAYLFANHMFIFLLENKKAKSLCMK